MTQFEKELYIVMSHSYDPYAQIQHKVLSNGLSVLAKEVDAPWLYVGFVCHGGAREDPPGYDGTAHLIEHLLSENVPGWTYTSLQHRLRNLGGYGRFGEVDYTSSSYHFFVPDEPAALREALSLYGEMLLCTQLCRQIEEEKAIITREFESDYPIREQRDWKAAVKAALFASHPRLSRYVCPLGTPETVERCLQQDIQQFYNRYYVPANLSVVSIGHLSHSHLIHALQSSPFGLEKSGSRNALPPPFLVTPPQRQELIVHEADFTTRPSAQARYEVAWALPSEIDLFHAWLLRDLLEEHLLATLRYEHGLTYDVEVSTENYQDCRLFTIALSVPPTDLSLAQDLLWHVLSAPDQTIFEETKQGIVNSVSRPDYSGFGLLKACMRDLEAWQRLISHTEARESIAQISYSEMMHDLSTWLTPERHFSVIVQP